MHFVEFFHEFAFRRRRLVKSNNRQEPPTQKLSNIKISVGQEASQELFPVYEVHFSFFFRILLSLQIQSGNIARVGSDWIADVCSGFQAVIKLQ